jgi:hypothetical protein
LLTDGLPNGSDEAAVVTEANITKSWGIVIYSIGLGSNVNTGLLRNISTSPDHYFEAPSTEELNAIYQQIAELISCS